MKLALQFLAVAAMMMSAVSQAAMAAEVSTPLAQAAIVVSHEPAAQIAQADIRSTSMPSDDAMQSSKSESFDSGKRDARAAAKQGPDALRRYVDRTRMIYALDSREFVRF